jgi:hypothetical protein
MQHRYTGWLVRESFLSSTTDTSLSRHDYSGNFVNLQLLLSYITVVYDMMEARTTSVCCSLTAKYYRNSCKRKSAATLGVGGPNGGRMKDEG